MTYILKTLKIKKRKYITCETDNYRSKKFYIKNLSLKSLGKNKVSDFYICANKKI